LESANDSAVAIAEAVSGSVEEFCAAMTRRAKELGAKDTVFETPNGLDTGDHHSTALDMALITRYAIGIPAFMEIINTESREIKSDRRTYTLNNRNRLLDEYDGADGVKTGFTGKAGHCFVGAARRGDMQLISVVLASGWGEAGKQNKWTDTKKILNYGFGNYSYETLVDAGKTAGTVAVERSRTPGVSYAFNESYTLPVRQDELPSLKVRIRAPESLRAPVRKGDILGQADVFLDGRFCKTIQLVSENSAERHDLKTSIEKITGAWLEGGSKSDVRVVLPEF
ncbi:MAG: D-alanyl-D-alanine carboxypeptidase, partial [Firmicutes bacterium]|nr:D-alanyl-D-alanine carboxypeptidase [Bacillota bacterium]